MTSLKPQRSAAKIVPSGAEPIGARRVVVGMRSLARPLALVFACLSFACSASLSPMNDADAPPALPGDFGPALTYTELFAQFFAPGTPGHCATAGCHADPGHNVWLCGTSKDTCYAGMVDVGLVDPAHPRGSAIADPTLSPLTWIDPAGGNMPFDAPGANQAGANAIRAWVAAGARNN
jgi:hypothetical protein